ncbi:MAG: FAD-dependent monooxygenase [Caldilineaceae bacterium]
MQPTTYIDYLIIGAGPAGLQLGYFLGKSGRDYLILDKPLRGVYLFSPLVYKRNHNDYSSLNTGKVRRPR